MHPERDIWILDQDINTRGVYIDMDAVHYLISVYERVRCKFNEELRDITSGEVQTCDKIKDLKKWIEKRGVQLPDVKKTTLERISEELPLPPDISRVIEIRLMLGAAAIKKLYAIKYQTNSDGRLRGLFQYYGASRTGRWAGRGPQPQNSPSNCVDDFDDIINNYDFEKSDNPIEVISGCIRGLYTAPPGRELICSDYSAIEAVVMAELSGEEWRKEVFRTHGKIYEMTASKISGVPFEEILNYKKINGEHHPLRKKLGKIPELLLQYQGWIGAYKKFGAEKYFETEDAMKSSILSWRDDSPMVQEFWGGQVRKNPKRWEFKREYYGLEGAAVQAMLMPHNWYRYRDIRYYFDGDHLYCEILGGLKLVYRDAALSLVQDNFSKLMIYQISYMGMGTDPRTWRRLYTYGGKLAENVVQATSRGILTNGMLNVSKRGGYDIVLHVHDEVVSEVEEGYGSLDEYNRLLTTNLPYWARGWPIRANGWRGKRYTKD